LLLKENTYDRHFLCSVQWVLADFALLDVAHTYLHKDVFATIASKDHTMDGDDQLLLQPNTLRKLAFDVVPHKDLLSCNEGFIIALHFHI
jgi:hypothetical protein